MDTYTYQTAGGAKTYQAPTGADPLDHLPSDALPSSGAMKVTAPATTGTTPADAYKGITDLPTAAPTGNGSAGLRTYNAGGKMINEDTGEIIGPAAPDEDAIRASVLGQFQSEIDATNAMYAEKMAEAKQQGLSRLGSTRAIQAARGELGTDVGGAQTTGVDNQNNQIENEISDEQAAKIAAIMGTARTDATNEIQAKETASQSGLDAYIKNLQGAPQRKADNLTKLVGAMIDQGTDPSQYGDANLATLASTYGVSPGDITSAYTSAKKTADATAAKTAADNADAAAKATKDGYITIGNGAEIYDTATGKIVQNPKTFSPNASDAFSPSDQRTLSQAGLGNASSDIQTYFANTDPAFQQAWTLNYSQGQNQNPTLQNLHNSYTEWYNDNKTSKTSKSSDSRSISSNG